MSYHHLRTALLAGVAACALAACSQGASTSTGSSLPTTQQSIHQGTDSITEPGGIVYHPVCGDVLPGFARCNSLLRDDAGARPMGPNISGLTPANLQQAYKLDITKGGGQTVAIVDAFGDPNAEADLAAYRSNFSLPACTTGNGCFKKTNQVGQQSGYPSGDQGWALETSLDLDMVSANCPKCNIILVEANSNSFSDLGASVTEAAKLGANVISNSYGGGEFSGEDTSSPFNAGVAVTASSGDGGYGTQYPAASVYVYSIGGTYLSKASNKRGWSEVVWGGTGSGCTQYVARPAWQAFLSKDCKNRLMNDVSYDASPGSGPAIYDTYGYSGWLVVGGTSVGSPAIAAIIGLAGNGTGTHNASWIYTKAHHTSKLVTDITTGSNGGCSPTILCNAHKGWDGPTGWGTPLGSGSL